LACSIDQLDGKILQKIYLNLDRAAGICAAPAGIALGGPSGVRRPGSSSHTPACPSAQEPSIADILSIKNKVCV
jgi:hypothetical protein